MVHFNNPYLDSFMWKQATYKYKPIKDWFVSDNGLLYNIKTKKFKYGHDNVEGKDFHQRVSIYPSYTKKRRAPAGTPHITINHFPRDHLKVNFSRCHFPLKTL